MVIEMFVLALASTVRPTSLAAVSALLARDSRRRLMFAYVIGGLGFTLLFGLLVIGVFHGVHIDAGSSRTRGIADIVGGVAALLFGCAVLTGIAGRRPARSQRSGGTWLSRLDREITTRAAVVFGPLTHLPGVFYLIALNVIVAHNARVPEALLALGTYNAVWFAVPLAALVVCVADPDTARNLVIAVQESTQRHSRAIILTTCFVVGVALLVRGLLEI